MPLDNFTKTGCVDCEKYWPWDRALGNTKQQILLSREIDPICTDWTRPFRDDKWNNKTFERIYLYAMICIKSSYKFFMINSAKSSTEVKEHQYCTTTAINSLKYTICQVSIIPHTWLQKVGLLGDFIACVDEIWHLYDKLCSEEFHHFSRPS